MMMRKRTPQNITKNGREMEFKKVTNQAVKSWCLRTRQKNAVAAAANPVGLRQARLRDKTEPKVKHAAARDRLHCRGC
jgi:hypothetical protein